MPPSCLALSFLGRRRARSTRCSGSGGTSPSRSEDAQPGDSGLGRASLRASRVPLSGPHMPCHECALPFHSFEGAVRVPRGHPARVEPRPPGARMRRRVTPATGGRASVRAECHCHFDIRLATKLPCPFIPRKTPCALHAAFRFGWNLALPDCAVTRVVCSIRLDMAMLRCDRRGQRAPDCCGRIPTSRRRIRPNGAGCPNDRFAILALGGGRPF